MSGSLSRLTRCAQACASDIDSDGNVNVVDLLQMLGQFGATSNVGAEDVGGDGLV